MKPKTHQSKSSGKVLLSIGIIWGMLSLIFLILGLRSVRTEQRFEAESVVVPGVIVSKRVAESNGIDPTTKRPIVSRTYYLKTTFADDRGRKREVENAVSAERWESAEEQDPVEVQYLPTDPAQSRIGDKSRIGQAYVFTGLGAVGVLMGLAVVLSDLRNRRALLRA